MSAYAGRQKRRPLVEPSRWDARFSRPFSGKDAREPLYLHIRAYSSQMSMRTALFRCRSTEILSVASR
jgi:hypothetical protein